MWKSCGCYTRESVFGAIGAVAALLCGCAGGGFGAELSARPAPQLIRNVEPMTLRLPAEQPFSIRLPQSSKEAGLNGDVSADAEVAREGTAKVSAEVANGGRGSGTVQVGHLFKNDTNRQLDLDIRVHYQYSFEVAVTPDERAPGGSAGIRLYARDGRNRLLRDFDLVHHTTEQGEAARRSDEDFEFTLTLGPDDSVAVYLAAQALVDTEEARSAKAALQILELKMEVTSTPAPAVQVGAANESR